jgi:hypothetical protein
VHNNPNFSDRARRAALEIFEMITGHELLQRPAPERRLLCHPFVPDREVTLLADDGGIGKSTIGLQLAAAVATGNRWFGYTVKHGPALYLSCEDDLDETHHRVEQIAKDSPYANFTNLHIISLAGQDAQLFESAQWKGGTIRERRPFVLLERSIIRIRPGAGDPGRGR